MRLRRQLKLACVALIAVLILASQGTIAGRAGTAAAAPRPAVKAVGSPPARTASTVSARLHKLHQKERQAFRRWLRWQRMEAIEQYLHAIWVATWETMPPDLIPTENCIKGVESGNYQEHSHPGSGSGAFQYIPSTWRAWLARWRAVVPGPWYDLAYQAPPEVQDAVLVYTLRNGGAGNWSGVDGCTGH